MGTRFNAEAFATGVAYFDLNGNNFYDIGEGLGGIHATVAGVDYYADTVGSGAYAVPLPGDGSYNISFSAPEMADQVFPLTVSGGDNVKQDLQLTYDCSGHERAGYGHCRTDTDLYPGFSAGHHQLSGGDHYPWGRFHLQRGC